MTNIATVFANVNGASFVSIDSETKVALKGGKGNPMKDRVTKRVTGSVVMVFQNKNSNGYENMVQRRLVAEGKDPESFQLGARAWGERIPNTPFVVHTNKDLETKYYIEVIFLKPGTTEYLLDGQPIAKEDVVGLDTTKKDDDGQGGLENKVIVRSYAVDSITGVRIDKTSYTGPFTYA